MTDFDKDSLKDSIRGDIHDRINVRIQGRINRGGRDASHGIILGAAISVVGVVLLLDHMGLVSAGNLWRFWPLLVVVAGAVNLAQPGTRPWGAFLILIGALLQLDSLGIIRFRWAELWPLAIIAAGAMMIWGSIKARQFKSQSSDAKNSVNATYVFGGAERRITARDFKYGCINAIFGGAELDFHGAEMEGDEAVMEINAIFGGVEIRVPDHWNVEVRNQTLFGGYSDTTTSKAAVAVGDGAVPAKKTFVITGQVIFGGIEVKN